MQEFKTLRVWHDALGLLRLVYQVTARFPHGEQYNFTAQMRSAALSILTNISEGCGRNSLADRARFFDMSMGSSCEFETLILAAESVGLIDSIIRDELMDRVIGIKKMLSGFLRRLRSAVRNR